MLPALRRITLRAIPMEKILIIDDEQDVHYSFKRLLDGEPLTFAA